MKRVGIVSYNMHYNYSNYGSILQTYALQKTIEKNNNITPVVIDYCPDAFRFSNPVNPLGGIKDESSYFYKTCSVLLKDIRENERKIREFINLYYNCSKKTYYTDDFYESFSNESLSGYICGSDAIWSYEYFKKFDDAFFANYECMKNSHTVAYAASFGETVFSRELREKMLQRMQNFKAIGLRESTEMDVIVQNSNVQVQRVLDPTFLLSVDEYMEMMIPKVIGNPYLLIYSRKYDPKIYETAEAIAKKLNLIVVEISLDIRNLDRYIMKYSAGIEEFLSLIYYSDYVITNSLHGSIFSIILNKDFYVYPRLHGNQKIVELLELLEIKDRILMDPISEKDVKPVNYERVNRTLQNEILRSKQFLNNALQPLAE